MNRAGCSFGYKLVHVHDQFSKSSLTQDVVHKAITSMVKESEYCSRVMKKHFNKKLVIGTKMMKILKTI